ncbi:MAG: MBL fold metallo-hydrolase [Bacillota bacterium]
MFTHLTEQIQLINGENQARFPFCNCLYIDDDVKGIVDTGAGRSMEVFRNQDIDIVINTHYHLDHVANNHLFPESKIMAHTLDAPAIRTPEAFLRFTGFDAQKEIAKDITKRHVRSRVDEEFGEGDIIDFGHMKLKVIHTPGHTPGHTSLYQEETGVLFSADIDLTSFGPWYANIRANLDDFESSIHRLADLNPKILVPSHSDVITEGIPERLMDYLKVITDREIKILNFLEQPRTLEEIVNAKIIFWKFPDPFYYYLEEIMVKKHLERLQRDGKITFEGNRYHWV